MEYIIGMSGLKLKGPITQKATETVDREKDVYLEVLGTLFCELLPQTVEDNRRFAMFQTTLIFSNKW